MTEDSISAAATRETLGSFLKRHRQSQGKDLGEIAEKTRIHASTLRAIEEDNHKALPAEVFTRGFVRNYARYLGLDPDQALAWYVKQNNGEVRPTEKINVREVLAGEVLAEAWTLPLRRFIIFSLVAGLLFLAGYFILGFLDSPAPSVDIPAKEAPPQAQGEQPPSLPASLTDAPGAESGTGHLVTEQSPERQDVAPLSPAPAPTVSPTLAVTKQPGMNYVLEAKFTEKTWLSVQIDKEKVEAFTYQPGEHAVWQAEKKISLFVGNAGGIVLFLNGKPVPSLGKSMVSARVTFPAE
ncbi:MAG: hypothetical protein A2505_10375 [Deltaproteobacteria bacterium RIFOXYD12_FULL_55_16]|nr:MAG: hypothetical protein A2505_10375 [Deltaproteobacteria bacterium RIFOXYD12_FULL_55_16]